MCHHHLTSGERADLREELEAEEPTEDEVEPIEPSADDERRLPPIPPSD